MKSCISRFSLCQGILWLLLTACWLTASPAGAQLTFVPLHSFGTDGAAPVAGLIEGADGDFYGTTSAGGTASSGTVFKITSAGTFTTLVSLPGAFHGAYPVGSLVQGSDGNFYGTAEANGIAQGGVVFRVTPSGVYTAIYDFVGDANGGVPLAGLIEGTDGDFYGTTSVAGAANTGTVFKITSAGTLTTLYSFSALDGSGHNSDGATPAAALIEGTDGDFYGTTRSGGTAGNGTVFGLFGPPAITSVAPASGTAGTVVTITGTKFTGATSVTVNGIAIQFTVVSSTLITFTIPAGLAGGVVQVTTPGGVASAVMSLTVLAWNSADVAASSDGTARMLWARSDGAAGIWVMSAANVPTTIGPTYGPFPGWSAKAVSSAGDGTSRVLWTNTNGMAGIWTFDATGKETAIGHTYGPYAGWAAADIATASNGTSRVLWTYTNGEAGLHSLNAAGGEIISGRAYGPFTGWTATAVGAAGDGTARMLWTRSDGAMGLWSMDAGDLQTTVGPTYGPYSDSHGTWRATDLSTSADGTSEVLWKRSDGAIGVWTFSANNTALTAGAVYGPYAGFTAAALDAASDKARVLWVQSNRAAGLWSFGANDAKSLIGLTYGPY